MVSRGTFFPLPPLLHAFSSHPGKRIKITKILERERERGRERIWQIRRGVRLYGGTVKKKGKKKRGKRKKALRWIETDVKLNGRVPFSSRSLFIHRRACKKMMEKRCDNFLASTKCTKGNFRRATFRGSMRSRSELNNLVSQRDWSFRSRKTVNFYRSLFFFFLQIILKIMKKKKNI